MERKQVYEVIDSERDYQDSKWSGHTHDAGSYILMIEEYAARARAAWVDNNGDQPSLDVVRKIAGIAVRCMEEHGAPKRQL